MEMLNVQTLTTDYLADDVIRCVKVMSMYTDLIIFFEVRDPGIEGNMVFHYLDVFGRPEDAKKLRI